MEVMNYYGNFDKTSVIIAQRRCKFSDSDVPETFIGSWHQATVFTVYIFTAVLRISSILCIFVLKSDT